MSIPVDKQLELRDPSGATVGVVVPEQALRELVGERDGLRQQAARLEEQLAALREQFRRVEAERDEYLQALHFLHRKELVLPTEEEIEQLKREGVDFGRVIDEIEQAVTLKRPGA